MNFFADFLILFGRFSENPRKCPFFRHFFASPCRSSGAFSAHILLQSLLRDHAEAQKGGSSRNLGGRAAWGRVCGRAKLEAGTLRCLRLCWRLPWDWLDAEQLGRCPKPHKGRCPLTPFRDWVGRAFMLLPRAAFRGFAEALGCPPSFFPPFPGCSAGFPAGKRCPWRRFSSCRRIG